MNMRISSVISRPATVSAALALALVLAGCSYFEEERVGNKVSGNRHVPILNQGMVKAKAGVPSYSPAVATAGAPENLPAVAAGSDPFNQFDAKGNKIAGKSSRSSDDEKAATKGWFEKPAPAVREPAAINGNMQDPNLRKPVMGNYQRQAEATAWAPPAPVALELPPVKSGADGEPKVLKNGKAAKNAKTTKASKTSKKQTAKTKKQSVAETPSDTPVDPETGLPSLAPLKSSTNSAPLAPARSVPLSGADEAPVMRVQEAPAPSAEVQPKERPSLVGRVTQGYKEDPRTEGKAYPSVASVPAKPQRLKQLREESEGNLKEMEAQRETAADEKQVVDSEPSELSPPPVMPAPKPLVAPAGSIAREPATSENGALPPVMMLKSAQ